MNHDEFEKKKTPNKSKLFCSIDSVQVPSSISVPTTFYVNSETRFCFCSMVNRFTDAICRSFFLYGSVFVRCDTVVDFLRASGTRIRLETGEFCRIMQNGKSKGTVGGFYEKWANVTHLIARNVRNLSELRNSFSGAFDFCGRSSTRSGESTQNGENARTKAVPFLHNHCKTPGH